MPDIKDLIKDIQMVDKYYNKNGDVAVLISVGYGAGWSSWANHEHREGMLFDRKIVEMLLEDPNLVNTDGKVYLTKEMRERIVEYCKAAYPNSYTGGISGLRIKWLAPGTDFNVDEYDGYEGIMTKEAIENYRA